MPLPRLELETSGFDTMLGFMHQPDEPKSLSSWEEVGNPLILHNKNEVEIHKFQHKSHQKQWLCNQNYSVENALSTKDYTCVHTAMFKT